MIKTFASYHHKNDQAYKEKLTNWAVGAGLIEDYSVSTGDIDENQDSQSIRRTIRDYYLRDSEVTVLLCGAETRFRKHVDWELKSTMIDGKYNKRSGILVINLPESESTCWHTCYPDEKNIVYPDCVNWFSVKSYLEYEERYPNMPRRILQNLNKGDVKISVAPWDKVYGNEIAFSYLLRHAADSGPRNPYDTSRPMRKKNYNPRTDYLDVRT